MKIISNELGRLTRLYVTDEVRPNGGVNSSELTQLIKDRYKFIKSPDPLDMPTKGAVFQEGSIEIKKKRLHVGILGIYKDGISVNAGDTESAETIVDDLAQWLITHFQFRKPHTPPVDKYENHMIVDFKTSPEKALKIYNNFKKLFESSLSATYGMKIPTHFLRMGIGVDPAEQPMLAFKSCDFTIERRVNRPYTENRFFSTSPLKTQDHITLLKNFEEML